MAQYLEYKYGKSLCFYLTRHISDFGCENNDVTTVSLFNGLRIKNRQKLVFLINRGILNGKLCMVSQVTKALEGNMQRIP